MTGSLPPRETGHCLCGAVRVEIGAHDRRISVCHCGMCRRWTGAAMWGFHAAAAEVRVTGKVATYASSEFAERTFCPACGSHLWFRETDGTEYEFAPGLFDVAADWTLDREIYSDRALACVRLEGGHRRITQSDHEEKRPHV